MLPFQITIYIIIRTAKPLYTCLENVFAALSFPKLLVHYEHNKDTLQFYASGWTPMDCSDPEKRMWTEHDQSSFPSNGQLSTISGWRVFPWSHI